MSPRSQLFIGVGDIHGRFHRVQEWIASLESALGREATFVLAVGDVEAFVNAEDHKRKAAKRAMPAEYADYAAGARALRRPMFMIGGNNEDFGPLHELQRGGELKGGVHYLGRVGSLELGGLRIAFLSGIYAPRHIDTELLAPTTRELSKYAGYFRRFELERLSAVRDIDLMLVHEWPRGLVPRLPKGSPEAKRLRAYRFPWVGNPETKKLVEEIRPAWLWAGHSHVPLASSMVHADGSLTRVTCLDQAAKPEAAVFWMEWSGREALRAGWGIDGSVAWKAGEPWNPSRTPDVAFEPDEETMHD